MKLGCAGCLVLIVVLTFMVALAGGFFFLSGNIFEEHPLDGIPLAELENLAEIGLDRRHI